jgi:hypothetical protein
MARKVIGPTGSRRRRWLFLCTSAVAIAMAVLVIPSAFAVHDEGVFQLDGNALVSLGSVPAMPSATEDADNICSKWSNVDATNPKGNDKCNVLPNSAANPPRLSDLPAATSSTRSAFVTDGSGPFASGSSDDQYTGGSKDSSDLSTWLYKNAASSNDKSDIENAFAGVYAASNGDKLIYFGGDRTSNSGDENTAFWFLQNPAAESPNGACTSNSGCPFTTDGKSLAQGGTLATHVAASPGSDNCLVPQGKDGVANAGISFVTGGACTGVSTGDTYGDILVVSAFTGGGNEPNTTAYEWIGNGFAKGASTAFCGTSSCTTIKILDTSPGCSPTLTGDAGCAVTDQTVQGTSCPTNATTGACVVGNATMPTQSPWIYTEKSSDNTNSGVNSCTTAANKMCPGVYFEGGLNLTKLGLQSECTSTFVMDTRSSQSVDSSLQDLAVGQVGSCTASISSKAGDTSHSPENSGATAAASPTSILGGSVSSGTDTAALQITGTNTWSGTVTWAICGPLTTIPTSGPKCDRTLGVPAGSASVSGTDQNTHYYVSNSVTLTQAGTYCWTAHFEPGSGVNSQITKKDDNGADECFTVAPVQPTLSTCAGTYDTSSPPICTNASDVPLGSAIHDRAYLSGLATEPGTNGALHNGNANYPSINATDLSYAGSITFTLRGPADTGCGGTPADSTGNHNPQSVDVNSTTGNGIYGPVNYTPTDPGHYHWQATIDNKSPYVSPNNTLPQSENNASCTDAHEDVTVLRHPTTTVTGPVDSNGASLTTAIKGVTSVFDNAVVTDTDGAGSPAPTGTVSFWICSPSQTTLDSSNNPVCTGGTPVNPDSATPPNPIPVSLTTDTGTNHSHARSTPAVVPNATGVWCFRATYNPDTGAFGGSSDNSNDECFNVVDVSMTTAQTFTLTDSATITPAGPGAVIGGSVVFSLFATSDCSDTGGAIFSDTETFADRSTAITVNAQTSYSSTASKPVLSWLVVYTPDSGATQKSVTKTCHTENASVALNGG